VERTKRGQPGAVETKRNPPTEEQKAGSTLLLLAGEFVSWTTSKTYRKNAADSLMLSEEAITRKSQTYWLTMAEFWFRLAQHVEETDALVSLIPLRSLTKQD